MSDDDRSGRETDERPDPGAGPAAAVAGSPVAGPVGGPVGAPLSGPAGGSEAGAAVLADDAPPAPRRRGGSFFRELPFLVLVAFVLALLIKAFLVQAFYIPSGSMEQTLLVNDRVLVNKLVYRFRDIHRGEVVVFNGLDSFSSEVAPLPPADGVQRVLRGISSAIGVGAPGEKDFIKRVIGVPGDRVACCTDGRVTVQPRGSGVPVPLDEPYVYQDDQMPFCEAGTSQQACPPGAPGVLVPEGRLWVLGDHRSQSSDSRAHIDDQNSGTVPADKVIGRAFVIVWPLDRATVLAVPETFDRQALAVASAGVAGAPLVAGSVLAVPVVALRRRVRRLRAARRG